MRQYRPTTLMAAAMLVLGAGVIPVRAQVADTPPRPAETVEEEVPVMLSPFIVDATKDKGYKATNATSGTRLNTAIKDIPLNLEVITSDFIRDTGAVSLRQALRYSAGVILESQSDAFVEPDADRSSAGANDPRGATRAPGDSTQKLRGFVISQVLRDGLRRQYSADSINIARVEVLRGPSALLYGVGSFGGVINYIPKRPEKTAHAFTSLSVGSNDFFRSELDVTGPMGNGPWQPGYRVTAAYQKNGDQTELYQSEHFMVAPVFSFNPFPKTSIVLDNEFGYVKQTGIGFQNIRSNLNAAASRTAGWLTDTSNGVIVPRTFRWSGPDTYQKGPFRNHVIGITQQIGDDFFIKVDAGRSVATFDTRQVNDARTSEAPFVVTLPVNYRENSTIVIGGTSHNLRSALTQANANGTFEGLTPIQIYQSRPPGSFRGDSLYGFILNNPIENQVSGGPPQTRDTAAIRYEWEDTNRTETRDQVRADLNYKLDLGKWGKHSFLLGTQYMKVDSDEEWFGPAYSYANNPVPDIERYSYKNPADYSYFRYGTQGDGRPDAARLHLENVNLQTWDLGFYGVYQGKFLDDRLTLIGGARKDRNDRVTVHDFIYESTKEDLIESRLSEKAPTATSPQIGVSYAINRAITVFGLYSTGVVPNYTARDGNGNAFGPTKAKNYEAGVKIDLLNGRVSGTISAYKIERTGTPKNLWWAPSPYESALKGYDPGKPSTTVWQYWNAESMWYAIKQTSVATAKKVLPSGFYTAIDKFAAVPESTTNPGQPDSAAFGALPEVQRWWDWSLDPVTGKRGLQGQAEQNTLAGTTGDGTYFPLVNMSDPDVAAFAQAAKVDYQGWGGNWQYTTGQTYFFGDGSSGVGNAPDGSGADVAIDDQARGWDAQVIFSPTENLQVIASYAHVKRKIKTQTYKFVSAPYWPLAWWYAKDGFFGTLDYNKTAAEVYGDVRDTTTYNAQIPEYAQSADDTPENSASVFAKYQLGGSFPALQGFSVGVGGFWEDRRQWFTGFTGGGGNISTVETPEGDRVLVQLWTKSRLTVNAFAEYRVRIADKYNARFAFNVDNLLDDQGRYGQLWAPGVSYRFQTSIEF